ELQNQWFAGGGFVDRGTFEERMREVGLRVVLFAREHVLQQLRDDVAFRVYQPVVRRQPASCGRARVLERVIARGGEFLGPWSAEEVIEYLWGAGKVPEWIDAAVESEDGQRSLIGLRCCGRFTASEELLYHRSCGLAPFSIKSPVLPPGWESVEASGRFDLHWRQPQPGSRPWWRFW